jgi:hypothetical protein
MSSDIAARFTAANDEAVAYVSGPAKDHWDAPTEAEGWPVGVVARHIGLGHELMASWARALRDRTPLPEGSDIHERNAEIAAQGVVATPEQVAELLRRGGVEVAQVLSELGPEHLEGEIDFGGRMMPRAMLAEASVRHVQTHLESIKAVAER